jgi:hypothetical protein
MTLFLSWSGTVSRQIAEALYEWLPTVLPTAEPWMSSADILPGSLWYEQLSGRLDQVDFGVLCVTTENRAAPWLIFEAGLLVKVLAKGRLIPYLFDCDPRDLAGPLTAFQAVRADRAGTRALVKSIAEAKGLSPEQRLSVEDRFYDLWPNFEARLSRRSTVAPTRTAGTVSPRQAEVLKLLADVPGRGVRRNVGIGA